MMRMMTPFLAALMLLNAATASEQSDSSQANFIVERITDGFGIPWGMTFIGEKNLLITERDGGMTLLDTESRQRKTLKGAPEVRVEGQGGLLDVAVPQDFEPGGWIYFTFVRDELSEGFTVLARARLEGDAMVDWQDLLVTDSAASGGLHFGSRIAFDDDGYLYVGVGDRGDRPNSQDLSNHAGSIMRLHRDGSVPEDNPFTGQDDARPEIWSYGHRNPQGMAYDHRRDRLWSIEHGPRGGDEINLIQRGKNYGWPVISYGKEYWGPFAVGEGTHRDGMEQPVKQYTPSIAPGSLLLYTGDAFPGWQGNLFAGALKLTHLNRVILDENDEAIHEERLLDDMNERIRALAQSPRGWIFFSTDSGSIYSIKPDE